MLFLAQTGLALDRQPRNRTTFSSPCTSTGTGPRPGSGMLHP